MTGFMAFFKSGDDVQQMDYTPSGVDIAAGDVVVIGNSLCGIATRPIYDGELGSLNIEGGIYEVVGDAAITAGKRVYWNASTHKVTETDAANVGFGITTSACSGNGETCDVMHMPFTPVDAPS
jgi:predicted RecA/RadA family phage recombinase